jgi:hypothetical protein
MLQSTSSAVSFVFSRSSYAPINIVGGEFMTVLAVHYVNELATDAPVVVLFASYWFQMLRIYTARHSTQVVKLKPLNDLSFYNLVDHTVRVLLPAVPPHNTVPSR